MALTVEEKIDRLKTFTGWSVFTEPQRRFLLAMVETENPYEAFKLSYPETKQAGLIFATQQMMGRAGIKLALAHVGLDTRKAVVSKREALELVSQHLRKRDIDPALLIKLLATYAKISGWDKPKESEDGDEVSMDKLVTALEKKRKSNG